MCTMILPKEGKSQFWDLLLALISKLTHGVVMLSSCGDVDKVFDSVVFTSSNPRNSAGNSRWFGDLFASCTQELS